MSGATPSLPSATAVIIAMFVLLPGGWGTDRRRFAVMQPGRSGRSAVTKRAVRLTQRRRLSRIAASLPRYNTQLCVVRGGLRYANDDE